MAIVGNLELSKQVLHKQLNFISSDKETSLGLYSGKNYSIPLLKSLMKKGLKLRDGIRELEDRFMYEDEKDLLLIVLDSIESRQPQKIKLQAPAKRKAEDAGDLKDVQLIVESKEETREVGINSIQQEKKRLDLRQYVMAEYSNVLGPAGGRY